MIKAIPAWGTELDFRTCDEVVGRALVAFAALTYQVCAEPDDAAYFENRADLAAYRADAQDTNDDAAPSLARVGDVPDSIWAWQRFSTATEDSRTVLPTSIVAGDPGRWVRQHLPATARCNGGLRYYQHVEFCDSRLTIKQLHDRCKGKMPSLFVSFLGDRTEEKSQTMAHQRVEAEYQFRILSSNHRGGVSARMTPPIAEEAAVNPGMGRMAGDLRFLLVAENRLAGTPGVLKIKLGGHRPLGELSAERVVCDAVDMTAILDVYVPPLPCELVQPWQIWLQVQDVLGRDVGEPNQVGATS